MVLDPLTNKPRWLVTGITGCPKDLVPGSATGTFTLIQAWALLLLLSLLALLLLLLLVPESELSTLLNYSTLLVVWLRFVGFNLPVVVPVWSRRFQRPSSLKIQCSA